MLSWFFIYLRFQLQKSHWHNTAKYIWDHYFRLMLKIQRIYQAIYDSSNIQRSI